MADRFPLILNTSANQIQEIASGDQLDLTGNNVANAGIITATSFSGPVVAGAGVSNITAGIGTYTDLRVGGDTTFSEDFVVTGNARVTGILTVGTSSIILNDSANTIKVGTALTLGHTQGLQFHTQNLHSAGFDVNQINASGIITATEADINGDLDVDGHTNLDNVNVAGVTTMSGNLTITNTAPMLQFVDTNNNSDYTQYLDAGVFHIRDSTNSQNRFSIASDGTTTVQQNLDVGAGIDVTGNVIASGNVTAVDGTFSGNIDANGELDVDGPTHLDYVSISGVTTHSDTVHIIDDKVLMFGSGGDSTIEYDENGNDQLTIAGAVTRFTNTTQSTSKDTGSVIFEGGIGVEKDLSVGGNVSIGGTLTYEDVTNIDSVGIVTARLGVFIPDSNTLKFGNTSASPDLKIEHVSSGTFNRLHASNGYMQYRASAHYFNDEGSSINFIRCENNRVDLRYNGSAKLTTETGGVNITGVCTVSQQVHTFAQQITGDNQDSLDFTGTTTNHNRGIAFNGKTALSYSNDTWLRLNNNSEFTSGVYSPQLIRADGGFDTDGHTIVNATGQINGSRILTGTIPVAQIGTGTKSASTFYRGDGTFATVTAPAITAINNATNNRVLTSEGGTTVNSESNLTFDGTNLTCGGNVIANNRTFGPGGNSNSTKIKSNATGSVALTLQDSGGNHRLELYGEGTAQGFLASAWGVWDLRKTVNGELLVRVGGTNYNAIHQGNVSGEVGLQNITVFTSGGTWTKPSGITRIKVYVTGGGGGGGSHNADDANGGGGSGGTAIEVIDVSSVSSVSVTVGSGGSGSTGNSASGAGNGNASSFGSYCTGGGGEGPNEWGIGGNGGSASGGDLNLRGGDGGAGNIDGYNNSEAGGSGGTGFWGGGPTGGTYWGARGGSGPYGAGGAGTQASSNNSGSAGQPGVVVIELYKS